jgi:hypothetical protein
MMLHCQTNEAINLKKAIPHKANNDIGLFKNAKKLCKMLPK